MVWSVFSLDANASGSYIVKHSGDDENAQIAAGIEWTVELADEDIYVADDLDYTVTMDAIEMDEGEYQFFVYYPQINYKDGRSAKEINKILKDKACFQMDNMYPEFKYNEDVDMGYYRSTVTYEISYMDNNLFSVVFYDEYFAGRSGSGRNRSFGRYGRSFFERPSDNGNGEDHSRRLLASKRIPRNRYLHFDAKAVFDAESNLSIQPLGG